MKSYQYLLFDWDGCLAKTLEVWVNTYKEIYAEYEIFPTDYEIGHHLGEWGAPKHFGIQDFMECDERVVALAATRLEHVELYEGAKELLVELAPQKTLALLSSSIRDLLARGIEHNHLEGIFQLVLTGEDVTDHKPHPEVIEKALAALGADPKDALMIGDSRKDLGAAQAAGVDSVLMYPDSHRVIYELDNLKTYNPTYIVKSFQELRELLG